MNAALTIAAAGAGAIVYGSLLEWAVHRFGYHDERVWPLATAKHRRHHESLYPAGRFFGRGGAYETSQPAWLEAVYVAAHLPVFIAIGRASLAAAIAAGVTLAIYAALTHYVHPMTHRRTGRGYERTWIWKRLVARHARHHQDPTVNLNLLLPLGDWLFGTLARPVGIRA